MPIKSEVQKIKLKESQDRRVKIPKDQHKIIKELHGTGNSIRSIARLYGVDKRLIQFILYPERQKASRGERTWRDYYDKDKWRVTMQEHRQYRRSILG